MVLWGCLGTVLLYLSVIDISIVIQSELGLVDYFVEKAFDVDSTNITRAKEANAGKI